MSAYVSTVDNEDDYFFLLGPFDTHAEAQANIERAREIAIEYNNKARFSAYNVTRAPEGFDAPGLFNAHLRRN